MYQEKGNDNIGYEILSVKTHEDYRGRREKIFDEVSYDGGVRKTREDTGSRDLGFPFLFNDWAKSSLSTPFRLAGAASLALPLSVIWASERG